MGPTTDECCDVHESPVGLHTDSSRFERIHQMPSTRATAGRVVAAGVAAVALAAIIGAVAFGAGQQPSSSPTPTASPTSMPAPTSPDTPVPATPAPTEVPAGSRQSSSSTPSRTRTRASRSMTSRGGSSTPVAVTLVTGCRSAGTQPGSTRSIRRPSRSPGSGSPARKTSSSRSTRTDGAPVLIFDQKAPYANTDALGADRVLVLTFDGPVDATKVDVGFPSVEASF